MTNFEPCAAEIMRRFARIAEGVAIEVGGGVAGYTGPDSPVNAAKGMDGRVGRAELQRVVDFYGDFGKDAVVELAPWVEQHCAAALAAMGFERLAHENVMARRVEPFNDEVEDVTDIAAFAKILSLAFLGEESELGRRLGALMHHPELGRPVGLREGGELVAVAQLSNVAGAGLLAGDGTLEAWRGRGLQQRLIRGRVARACTAGLEWVHSEVAPGSGSARNYQRCGFRPIYARTHYLRRFQ